MRKFFSVLLCFILIISICFCASVPGSAVFIVDDAFIASIGISLAASVLLSIGIAAVSDSESIYVQFAEACGQSMLEEMLAQYSMAEVLSMIVIENGKAFFKCPENLYTRLRNFANNFNWGSLHLSANLSDSDFYMLDNYTSYTWNQVKDHCGYGYPNQVISYTAPTYQFIYTPGNTTITAILNDGFAIKRELSSSVLNLQSLVLPCITRARSLTAYRGNYRNGSSAPPGSIVYVENSQGSCSFFNSSCSYFKNGETVSLTSSGNDIYLNGSIIATGISSWDYGLQCFKAGCLLSNVSNPEMSVNSNSGLTSINVPVETETYSPSIPGGRVGSDQSVLVPIPSTFEDPSNPGIPLPQRTVKNRVKRGQDVVLVPDLPSLKDKTPQDLGVLVVNNTEIEDTVISPTLSTTYIGENSTTFVIIPDNPGSTPIPDDNDSPLVSNPYPDVINPGNETISITANDDIFPTASEGTGENTTVRPSVSVSNPDEVASSAASEIVEGVSDIVKEGVSDLATPLTPGEIEKGANRMRLAPQLLSKFPFCIPFDFYNSINQLSAPSEVPQFDIPFQIQSINFNHTFHIDLTNFETAAKISRWFFSVAWIVTLIFLTRKVIWK